MLDRHRLASPRTLAALAALAAVLALGGPAARPALAGDPPDGRALVLAAKAKRAKGERRDVQMEIVGRSGKASKRTLAVQSYAAKDDERTLIRFSEPRDVARLGLLTVQRPGEEDEQHLYLPSQKKVKRIASSDRTGLFAGTDFAFEDLRFEDLDEHEYRTAGEETVAGEACHRVEATPKGDEAESSGYGRRDLLVSKTRGIVLEARMYAREGGALVKVVKFSDWRDVGGHLKPFRVEVDHKARESKTVTVVSRWVVDDSLGPDDFTPFKLERGQ